jgi:hypothetical protein
MEYTRLSLEYHLLNFQLDHHRIGYIHFIEYYR